jgi:flavin reductase (DIM6/NTAB) family NADH-FMN oxidoreductase RutF
MRRQVTSCAPERVVLVTSHDGEKDKIMTISWTRMMDFTTAFAITTGEWNYSFAALRPTFV